MKLHESRFQKQREKFLINKNKINNKQQQKKDIITKYTKREGKRK